MQQLIILMIILAAAAVFLLFLLLMTQAELLSIVRQLKKIKRENTNALIRREGFSVGTKMLIHEINALVKELQYNRIYYKRKKHDLEQMMTNISHDLRTPLTSALGYINIIKNSGLSEEEKNREIEIIEQRLLRLEELINSFFEFSKIISSDKMPEKEEVNLVAILEETAAHYFDDYSSQGRDIVLSCDKSKIILYSNKNMLMRIFDNLINNALKHGCGRLDISANSTGDTVICFRNDLFDSEVNTEKIFDEFYTTDISRTKGNTGLGLAIVKQFTEILGGKISAQYENNVFSITILFRDKIV
ncbi:MAG: HAMP domain-containing histidine kinase [Clostridia bacterium]|nr:HAMP domain-containing histidine kinase [Clostridia bacterium]